MTPRVVFVALLVAFGMASTLAAITTVRQVRTEASALPQPVAHI